MAGKAGKAEISVWQQNNPSVSFVPEGGESPQSSQKSCLSFEGRNSGHA
jgi:hypothetical protein